MWMILLFLILDNQTYSERGAARGRGRGKLMVDFIGILPKNNFYFEFVESKDVFIYNSHL